MSPLFGAWLGPQEIIILLILGVLLFGRRLPEVGRYLGKGIVEFKKGVKGLEDDMEGATGPGTPQRYEAQVEAPKPPQRITASAPKFEDVPPPGAAVNAPPGSITTPPKVG